MAERYNFKYLPLVGKLPGKSMVEQTETAINELASVVYNNVGHVGNLAEEVQTANTNASNALDKATEALETSSRVYIKQIAAVDVNDYYDSELYYINNDGSTNIPVRDRGFLEVKTNDDKTACEQVFIADSTGTPYYRHGRITEQTLGEKTTYVVTWSSWYRVATTKYVQAELQDYLPLSGGTMTTGNTLITMGNGESYVRNWANGLYLGGTYENNATRLVLFTNSNAQGFQLDAGDGTTFSRMDGRADGTLTWNGQPLLPVGVVQAFAGRTIPTGWLLCDGSAVSRTTYANLYACIGTTYGAGNGSTTFNLPNLVDKFVEGSATAGTVKSAGLPNIKGEMGFRAFTADNLMTANGLTPGAFGYTQGSGVTFDWKIDRVTNSDKQKCDTLYFNANSSNSIYSDSVTTVQPPALTMRYIIKY